MNLGDAVHLGRKTFPNSAGPRPVLNNPQFEALVELVEQGPLPQHPHNCAMYEQLVQYGFASNTVVKGNVGYYAATYKGAARYAQEYGEESVEAALYKRKHLIQDHE